ncbi:MAG: urea carboxylase-associated family protein [Myxococcota bacterium]|nr:urea carboxylase-associated family protein [Myxococcota bacterium]
MNIIPAKSFDAFQLHAGQLVCIIDIEGGQVVDLTAFRLGDATEWLSNGRSFDYNSKLLFTTGDVLYSNKSRPMLTIVQDSVGRHDFLYTPCSEEMYRIQYGITGPYPNCLDNLRMALKTHHQEPAEIPTPFNVFMNVEIQIDGSIFVKEPVSTRGDKIILRAEMGLIVALSACPAPSCNGGKPKSVGYEVISQLVE